MGGRRRIGARVAKTVVAALTALQARGIYSKVLPSFAYVRTANLDRLWPLSKRIAPNNNRAPRGFRELSKRNERKEGGGGGGREGGEKLELIEDARVVSSRSTNGRTIALSPSTIYGLTSFPRAVLQPTRRRGRGNSRRSLRVSYLWNPLLEIDRGEEATFLSPFSWENSLFLFPFFFLEKFIVGLATTRPVSPCRVILARRRGELEREREKRGGEGLESRINNDGE